jgi:hypothetical protein
MRTVVLGDPVLDLDIPTHTHAPSEGGAESGVGGDPGYLSDVGDLGDLGDLGILSDSTAVVGAPDAAVDPLDEAVRLLRPLPLAEAGSGQLAGRRVFGETGSREVPAASERGDGVDRADAGASPARPPEEAADPLDEAVRLTQSSRTTTGDGAIEQPSRPVSAPRRPPLPPRPPQPPRIGSIDGPASRGRQTDGPFDAASSNRVASPEPDAGIDDGAEPMWVAEQVQVWASGSGSAEPAAESVAEPGDAVEARRTPSGAVDFPRSDSARSAHISELTDPPLPPPARPRPRVEPEPTAAEPAVAKPVPSSPSGLLSRIADLTDPPPLPPQQQRDRTVAIPRTRSAPTPAPRALFRDELDPPEPPPTALLEVPEFLVPGFGAAAVPADPATGLPLGTVLSGVLGPDLWRRCHVEWSGAHCVALARIARGVDGLAPAAVTSLVSGATAGLRWLGATREQDELAGIVADTIAHPDGVSQTNSARTIRLYGAAICSAVGRPLRRCACHRDLARDVSEELIELGLAGLVDSMHGTVPGAVPRASSGTGTVGRGRA